MSMMKKSRERERGEIKEREREITKSVAVMFEYVFMNELTIKM